MEGRIDRKTTLITSIKEVDLTSLPLLLLLLLPRRLFLRFSHDAPTENAARFYFLPFLLKITNVTVNVAPPR